MANYLVLIYENEADWAQADAAAVEERTRQHGEFAKANGPALRGGARLAGSGSATSTGARCCSPATASRPIS